MALEQRVDFVGAGGVDPWIHRELGMELLLGADEAHVCPGLGHPLGELGDLLEPDLVQLVRCQLARGVLPHQGAVGLFTAWVLRHTDRLGCVSLVVLPEPGQKRVVRGKQFLLDEPRDVFARLRRGRRRQHRRGWRAHAAQRLAHSG